MSWAEDAYAAYLPHCAECDGTGQRLARTERVQYARTSGGGTTTGTLTYYAPCPHCDRGRRIAARRAQGRTAQREVA